MGGGRDGLRSVDRCCLLMSDAVGVGNELGHLKLH